MIRVFDYYRLQDFFGEVLRVRMYTFAELAKRLGLTIPSVSLVFHGEERLVADRVQDWKKAFEFKRLEGEYFELLAILAAYPTSSRQVEFRRRAFHLVRRFLKKQLFDDLGYDIFFWLSPECSMLRNLIDLSDCPKDSEKISSWAVGKLTRYRRLKKLSKTKLEKQLVEAWECMEAIRAVEWSALENRWTKTTPVIETHRKSGPPTPDIVSSLLVLPHSEILSEFGQLQGTEQMIMSYIGTLSLPEALEPLVVELCREFVRDLVSNLVIACSKQDLDLNQQYDPEVYERAITYRRDLEHRGKVLPELKASDFDAVSQIVFALRRLTS